MIENSPTAHDDALYNRLTIRRGVLAGVLSGAIMAVAAMLHSWFIGAGFWTPVNLIAATFWGLESLLGGPAIALTGLAIHFVVSVFWGISFASLLGRNNSTLVALIGGVLFGILIWAMMTWIVLPLINGVMLARVNTYEGWWFALHLIYGGALLTTPLVAPMPLPEPSHHHPARRPEPLRKREEAHA